jgi:hypothetical protein
MDSLESLRIRDNEIRLKADRLQKHKSRVLFREFIGPCGIYIIGVVPRADMRARINQCLSVVAIVAIAMHGALLGLAPLAAAAGDPLSVICHSAAPAQAGDEQAPSNSGAAPQGCEHCNLCSAAAAPAALDDVVAEQLVPARLLQILLPVSAVATASIAASPKLAQGPPAFA